MVKGKKYVDSAKLIDRAAQYDVDRGDGPGRARPPPPSLTRPWSCT